MLQAILMHIVIIEKDPETREQLKQLLMDDGFDQLEIFPTAADAVVDAHWKDADLLMTADCTGSRRDSPVVDWVRQHYPHITPVRHTLNSQGFISYALAP